MKAMGRVYLILYALYLIFMLLLRIPVAVADSNSVYLQILSGIILFSASLVFVVIFVITGLFLFVYFYRCLFTARGYLYFTLPVTVGEHLISKTLSAFCYTILSGIVLAGVPLLVFPKLVGASVFRSLAQFFDGLFIYFTPGELTLYALEILLLAILQLLLNLFLAYLSMATGQLLSKFRILFSLFVYSLLNMLNQSVFLIIMLVVTPGIENVSFLPSTANLIHAFLLLSSAVSLIFLILTIFLTHRILKKHLNLE